MLYLYIYLFLLLGTLYLYLRKKKNFDAGALLLVLYSTYAVFSCLLYSDDNLEFKYYTITLFPLLFLFVCLIISFWPVMSFNTKRYEAIQEPKGLNLKVVAWVFVLSYLFQIEYIITHLSHGLLMILLSDDGVIELYNEMADHASEGGIGISNIFSIIGNMLYGFGVLLLFYFLSKKQGNRYLIIGLTFAILIGILEFVASGQRGGMIKRTLVVIGTFFLLKDYIGEKTKKWIKRCGIIVLSVIGMFFIIMSISRFGEREGGVGSSYNRYAGQAVIYFDQYAFDNNGIRYGDRTIPVFKRLLLFDNVPKNYYERRAKYPKLKINDEVFVTFVGDFCLDFGPLLAFLIILSFSLWTKKATSTSSKAKVFPFHKLYLLHMAMRICLEGGSLFSQADLGNVSLMLDFMIYMYLRFNYAKITHRLVNTTC